MCRANLGGAFLSGLARTRLKVRARARDGIHYSILEDAALHTVSAPGVSTHCERHVLELFISLEYSTPVYDNYP